MNKKQAQKQASDAAANLSRVAMRLSRAKAEDIDGLLLDADRLIRSYKQAKARMATANVADISPGVRTELTLAMGSLGEVIEDTVAPHHFALFVMINDADGSELSFTSNVKNEDLAQVLREYIVAVERGTAP